MERNKLICAARGCDGCKVCVDHSEDARQMVPSASAQEAEPIYQVQMADGSWIDQAEHNYRFNLQFVSNKVRIVYAAPAPIASPAALTDEPTPAMYEAAQQIRFPVGVDGSMAPLNTTEIRRLWVAMLAASPAGHSGDSADMVASVCTCPSGNVSLAQCPVHTLTTAVCRGMNCGATDGSSHSDECAAEHDATVTLSKLVKSAQAGEGSGDICRREGWNDAVRAAIKALTIAASPAIEDARASRQGVALSDEAIQSLWNEACNDGPGRPGWSRHIRFARAILSRASSSRAEVEIAEVAPGKLGNYLMWATEDARLGTPVGTKLHAMRASKEGENNG